MIICVCNKISQTEIEEITKPNTEFEDLQIDLGIATQCGRCETLARIIWQNARDIST